MTLDVTVHGAHPSISAYLTPSTLSTLSTLFTLSTLTTLTTLTTFTTLTIISACGRSSYPAQAQALSQSAHQALPAYQPAAHLP